MAEGVCALAKGKCYFRSEGCVIFVPNIKSAKKRVKITAKKNLRNKILKTNLKTVTKKVFSAVASGAESRQDALKNAIKKLDQAVKKGVIHKNCAARKKSQLTKLCK
jgi:small subunit ribosomal protein S20